MKENPEPISGDSPQFSSRTQQVHGITGGARYDTTEETIMTNQSTIVKLIEMDLLSMADAFRIQLDDTAMKEVPFEDRFSMLVNVEYTNRKNNRLRGVLSGRIGAAGCQYCSH